MAREPDAPSALTTQAYAAPAEHDHAFGQDRRRPGERSALDPRSCPCEPRARGGHRVTDLHVWSIGVGLFALQATIVSPHPKSPSHYKTLLPKDRGLVHAAIELHLLETPGVGAG
jgi:hypothetical protein